MVIFSPIYLQDKPGHENETRRDETTVISVIYISEGYKNTTRPSTRSSIGSVVCGKMRLTNANVGNVNVGPDSKDVLYAP